VVYKAGVVGDRGGKEWRRGALYICVNVCVRAHTQGRVEHMYMCVCVPVDVHVYARGGHSGRGEKGETEGRMNTHADTSLCTHTREGERARRKRDKESDTDRARERQ
jgi:hypothetical protein